MALKFVEHFLWIASSMTHLGGDTGHVGRGGRLLLRRPSAARRPGRAAQGPVDGRACCPCARRPYSRGRCWRSTRNSASGSSWFLQPGPKCRAAIHDPRKPGVADRQLASILDETKLRRVLAKMLDENEFLSPFGIRSLSRYHADHPYVIHAGGQEYRVAYLPAESDTGMFGGNSNWRGPIWMPVNALIIRALLQYYPYYGDDFTVECPTGSGRHMNLYQVAEEIAAGSATSSSRTRTASGRSTAAPESSRTTRTGATACSSTSISTATTGRVSGPATRPAGPASSPGSCTCSRRRRPSRCFGSENPRRWWTSC